MASPEEPERREEPAISEWERAWEQHRKQLKADRLRRGPIWRSVLRGLLLRCPNCGVGKVILGYLLPNPSCDNCGEGYGHIRTDDLAPWVSIVLLGHLLLPAVISVERLWHPPFWVHCLIWLPIGFEMVVALLPRAKGAALGLMWSMGLRGDEHQY